MEPESVGAGPGLKISSEEGVAAMEFKHAEGEGASFGKTSSGAGA